VEKEISELGEDKNVANPNNVEEATEDLEEVSQEDLYSQAWDKDIDESNPQEEIKDEADDDEELIIDAPKRLDEAEPIEKVREEIKEEDGLLIKNPVLNYKGRAIRIDDEQELINLAQKGFKLELEMGRIKPKKRLLRKLEENGITDEDIQALIDLKNKKSGVIAFLKRQYGIEEDDYGFDDDETKYTPEVEEVDPLQEYIDTLSEDKPEVLGKAVEILKQLDDGFKAELNDVKIFPAFIEAVEMGEFEKAYPYVLRVKATNPASSWLQAYQVGVQKMIEAEMKTKKQSQPDKDLSPTRGSVKRKRGKISVDDIWNDSSLEEELFNKYFS
jgi:hypothetical protein